jgi:hypothetical protein
VLDGTHNDGPPVTDANLFDPGTNTFRSAGMTSPSVYWQAADTATLLMNGKVLVTRSGDGPVMALLYDPPATSYVPIGNVSERYRNQHTGTLLPDGRVLLAGGDRLGEAILYDPSLNAFTPAANMSNYRRGHTATLLPDGTVLIAGGAETPPVSLNSAQIYQPAALVAAPSLLWMADGSSQGAILHAGTSEVASAANPASVGEALEIYLTGLIDGAVIPPLISIGGRSAELLYFGKAPGFRNLNQVNVRVPSGVRSGARVPVRITYLARPSNEVTIGVR